MIKARLYILLASGLTSLGGALVLAPRFARTSAGPQTLRMMFTYPITSINPALYDDWESVFIGNHIYRRLLPEEDKPAVQAVAKAIQTACEEPKSGEVGQDCRRIRIEFTPIPFADCAGHRYEAGDIRGEFETLLSAKSWAIPDWQRCEAGRDRICVTGTNVGDISRRLQNVNFRFGWSKRVAADRLYGAGPYCLQANLSPGHGVAMGSLESKGSPFLPRIDFSVGPGRDGKFNIALYGSKELLEGTRKNVQAHTPIAYYVVTNPALAKYRLPWNTAAAKEKLRSFFARHDVFFASTTGIERLVPNGAALDLKGRTRTLNVRADFAIPDYLPGCRELAAALTEEWKGSAGAKAVCVDIVNFVQAKVHLRRGTWAGFLAGTSPSDPGRDAIRLQYFSTDSPDRWTYEYGTPSDLFYLAGIGQSLVTVDGKKVCDLRPNPLGLSNIFVTDFIGCQG